MKRRTLCIYHGNCADGFGAAWVVRKMWLEEFGNLKEIEFVPGVYQTGLPPNLKNYSSVIIVDFSYKRADMISLYEQVPMIIHIDHHKSAIEDLSDLHMPDYHKDFSLENSGAILAWNHYFGCAIEPPKFLQVIEDRDLWKFKFGDTRNIMAAIFSYPYDFEVWDTFETMSMELLASQGEAIERKHFKDIRENLTTSVRWMNIAGVLMPVVNCPKEWGSDAAHILAENAVNHCAGYYWDSPAGRNFGLRSVEEMDVSKLAIRYGGGGHKNAAGFRVSPRVALSFEVEADANDPNSWNSFRQEFCIPNPKTV